MNDKVKNYSLEKDGFLILRNVIDPISIAAFKTYASLKQLETNYYKQNATFNWRRRYADPLAEAYLKQLLPLFETQTGKTLFPTYSVLRDL